MSISFVELHQFIGCFQSGLYEASSLLTGIIVGVLLAILLITAVVLFILLRRR